MIKAEALNPPQELQVATRIFRQQVGKEKEPIKFSENTLSPQIRSEEPGRESITLYTDCDVRINALPSIFQTNFLYGDGE